MQTLWQQNYDPAGNIWISALVALIPIVFFFLALTKLRLKGYQAGTVTVLLALGVALLFYKMPVSAALASAESPWQYNAMKASSLSQCAPSS